MRATPARYALEPNLELPRGGMQVFGNHALAQGSYPHLVVDAAVPLLNKGWLFKDAWIQYARSRMGVGSPSSQQTEMHLIKPYLVRFSARFLTDLTRDDYVGVREDRLRDGKHPNSVNQAEALVLRVIKHAVNCGQRAVELVSQPALDTITKVRQKPLRVIKLPRRLLSSDEVLLLAQVAREKFLPRLADLILFLAYSGTRVMEALNLKWEHINWERAQVQVGYSHGNKNGEVRHVDFTPPLLAHLKEMLARRKVEKGEWLFPGNGNQPMADPSKAMAGVYATARINRGVGIASNVGLFHLLRHYFASCAVMSNVDYMTIARWLGHKDGGVLVAKVYGHLNQSHLKRMAAQMSF